MQGLKVLLVDTDDSRPGVTAQLTQHELQYAVTCCSTSTEALAYIRTGAATFDVVLAESMLVASDDIAGRAFIDAFDGTPVILMSESDNSDDVLKAVRLGAVDFLNKPLSLLKLKNIWQHQVRKMMQRTSLYDSRPAYSEPAPARQQRSISGCLPSSMTAPMQPLGQTNEPESCDVSMKCATTVPETATVVNPNRSSVDSPGTPCGAAEYAETVSATSVGQPGDLSEPSSTLEGPERASFESLDGTTNTCPTPAPQSHIQQQVNNMVAAAAPPMAALAALRPPLSCKSSSFGPLMPVPPVSQWPRLPTGCVWGTPLGGPIPPPLPNQTGLEAAPAPPGMATPQPILIKKPAPLPVQPAPLTTNQVPMPEGFLAKDELAKAVNGPIGLRLRKSDSLLDLLNSTLGDDAPAAKKQGSLAGLSRVTA